jgi:hypothetical protein
MYSVKRIAVIISQLFLDRGDGVNRLRLEFDPDLFKALTGSDTDVDAAEGFDIEGINTELATLEEPLVLVEEDLDCYLVTRLSDLRTKTVSVFDVEAVIEFLS